jgi:hypothetical protein
MPLFSIAGEEVTPAGQARPLALEWKADPYGFERRPNGFPVRLRNFPAFLERGNNPRRDGGGLC